MNAKAMFSLHSIRSGEQLTAGEILHSGDSHSFFSSLFALLIPCSKFTCSIFLPDGKKIGAMETQARFN